MSRLILLLIKADFKLIKSEIVDCLSAVISVLIAHELMDFNLCRENNRSISFI